MPLVMDGKYLMVAPKLLVGFNSEAARAEKLLSRLMRKDGFGVQSSSVVKLAPG